MRRWLDQKLAKKSGFTIVELLIVIVVIGVLATIVVVGYGAVANNTRDTALKADLEKIADVIKLSALDNDSIPTGGATSSLTGDSTNLPGIQVSPSADAYDQTVNNLFYCEGTINGNDEFALVAQSVTGKVFAYVSDQGMTELDPTPTPWDYAGICTEVGFVDPYTWSYGYNPLPQYGWFRWTLDDDDFITNLITNPSFESNVTGWASYIGLNAPTRTTSNPVFGDGRLSAVGNNSSLIPRVYIDIPAVDGDTMALSYYVRSDGVIPTSAYVAVKHTLGGSELSGGASFYAADVAWEPGPDGWVSVSASFTVPSGGDGIRLTLGVRSAVNYTGTLGIDGVILVKDTTTALVYADGNTLNWEWDGVTNNSTSSGPPS